MFFKKSKLHSLLDEPLHFFFSNATWRRDSYNLSVPSIVEGLSFTSSNTVFSLLLKHLIYNSFLVEKYRMLSKTLLLPSIPIVSKGGKPTSLNTMMQLLLLVTWSIARIKRNSQRETKSICSCLFFTQWCGHDWRGDRDVHEWANTRGERGRDVYIEALSLRHVLHIHHAFPPSSQQHDLLGFILF